MEDSKIKVEIDSDLEDIIPGYLENRRKDISAIKEAISNDDFEKISILAHSMKGSGGGYGFNGITDIGGRMETAAKSRDTKTIESEIENLKDYLDRVEITFVSM